MNLYLKPLESADNWPNVALPCFADANANFLTACAAKASSLNCILYNGNLAGLVLMAVSRRPFLYIFIFPQFRSIGMGKAILAQCENALRSQSAVSISTSYRTDNPIAQKFSHDAGYRPEYSESYMEYAGATFEIPELPIRQYRDEDYASAHEMYAEAFHRMRLSSGFFPNSVPEPPNDRIRRKWAASADERFVYMRNTDIIGYAHIAGNEIGSISIRQDCQGQGIGQNFVKAVCNTIRSRGADKVSLYCVNGNRARHLYDRLGFIEQYKSEYAKKHLS